MNADSEVMKHFPATLSFEQSAALIERIEAGFEMYGYRMRRDPSEDFDHPLLAESDPLRAHVLYRLRRDLRR